MKKLIKFEAPWCNQCKALKYTLDKVMKDFSDVTLEIVDCDEHEDIAQKYNIRNLPTLVYLKNNEEVGRIFGAVPASKIVELLNK